MSTYFRQSLLRVVLHCTPVAKKNNNIASRFVWSNSIARACFLFLLCTLMTSANKSLEKKIFHQVENVIKQLVHTSAVRSSRYEALGSLESTQEAKVVRGYALSNSWFRRTVLTHFENNLEFKSTFFFKMCQNCSSKSRLVSTLHDLR